MTRSQNYRMVALALALLLILSAPILANEVQGNIAMINADNHTFILVDNNNNVLNFRFLVGGDVFLNDEATTLWDVNPGDQVTVTYTREGNELQATAIRDARSGQ